MDQSCFICNKHRGEINIPGGTVYEDDHVVVTHIDLHEGSVYLGYFMVDLRRHAPTLADMTIEEASAFGIAMKRVSEAMTECLGAEHIYAIVSGHGVAHLHIHLTPRYPNTPDEYWGPRDVLRWPDAPRGGTTEVEELCEKVRAYMMRAAK